MKIPKHKPIENSVLLAEQAQRLSERLLTVKEAGTIGAEENPLRGAARALAGDYARPISRPLRMKPGQIADPTPLNKLFTDVKMDLEVLAMVSKGLEDALVLGHNVVATKENDLLGELKTLRDRIAVLKLYATDITDDDLYLAFTFTDGLKISSPEEGEPLAYEEAEGALTLPIAEVRSPEIEVVRIADGSNGVPGNNFQRDRQRNGALEALTDGQPMTLFEYERIGENRTEPLKLVLNFKLREPSVVNRITINPANLGTSNWVRVEDIEIQTDQRFTSVRGDVQSPLWDPGSDPFRLSPAASKYAGQGVYTFAPRLAKAVQITLRQDESYPILEDRRDRYAIALREIAIEQVAFGPEGSFLLREQRFARPVRALGLMQNLMPFDPELGEIGYSVSVDGGVSWTDMVPLENKDAAKLEAFALPELASAVILKGEIKRKSDGFRRLIGQGDVGLTDTSKVLQSNTVSAPITLEAEPLHYLEVIETRYGHAGRYGPKLFLGRATGTLGNQQVLELPVRLDKNDITLLVNGEPWERVNAFVNHTARAFVYDESGDYPVIRLGDGVELAEGGLGGALPPAQAELYLAVAREQNPRIEAIPGGYKFHLKYGASKVRETTAVIFRDFGYTPIATISAGPDATYIDIPWEHTEIDIANIGTPELSLITHGNAVPFRNGEIEFENLAPGNYYSVDYEGNRIYLASPVPRTGGDMTVEYAYTVRRRIPESEWRYSDRENSVEVRSDLVVPKQGFTRRNAQLVERVLNLSQNNIASRRYSIIPGTVKGLDENGVAGMSRVLQTEVKYINGSEEFERLRVQGGSLLGYFSVNYGENTLHLPRFDGVSAEDRGFLPGKIVWDYVSSEFHYNLGRKLEGGREFYHKGKTIEMTPYYLDRLEDLSRRIGRSVDLHIRYNMLGEHVVEGGLLEPFYSPVLRDLAIVGVGVDSRLGTLESL